GLLSWTRYRYRVRATDAAGNLGDYSSIATAITPFPPDTTPPTDPTNLTATAASTSAINLAWTASTDDVGVQSYLVERCQGAGCSNFAQIGTSSAASFGDTGLLASTSYSYRVRARDAAGNNSGYSNAVSATTQAPPDTTPPTAPANLTATASSPTSVNLAWTASTDNVGVQSYFIERCQGAGCSNFAQIGTASGTSFTDAALVASATYGYRVRAGDAAGNLGGFSNTATATTGSATVTPAFVQVAAADPQSPQASVGVTFTAAQTTGNLNVVIVGWNDTNAQVATVTDTKGNSYVRAVGPTQLPGALSQSIYYAKNIAGATAGGNTVTVTFNTAAQFADVRILEYSGLDQVAPLDGTAVGSGSGSGSTTTAALTTTGATDLLVAGNTVATGNSGAGPGFTSRIITVPDSDIAEDRVVSAPGSYTASAPLIGSGAWVMQLVAFKGATTGVADSQPPTAPSGLTALAASPAQINLTWTSSTDNVGVSNYVVERCQGAGCSSFAQ
ncbi:MAG TPA: fibronectin type III domain-containing protein, partial [Actinomycetota bacterium]|nr:fibronectin type III domain-containing protein [Actinomycetota bacterium]